MHKTPFPENCKTHLQTFINLNYSLFAVPFKLNYDDKTKKYNLLTSYLRQVTCFLRVLGIVCQIANSFRLGRYSDNLQTYPNGPLKIFRAGGTLGSSLVSLFYVICIGLPSTQRHILELFNLQLVSPNSSTQLSPSAQIRKDKINNLATNVEFSIHFFLIYILCFIYVAHQFLFAGLNQSILNEWISLNKIGQDQPGSFGAQQCGELAWWKKIIAVCWMLSRFDSEMCQALAIILIFFVCRMLQATTINFHVTLIELKNVCNIPCSKVIHEFKKIRQFFSITSKTFGPLVFVVMYTQCITAAMSLIWLMRDAFEGTLPIMIIILVYICWTLFAAANGAAKSMDIVPILNTSFIKKSKKARDSFSLQREILCYEVTSGNFGFCASKMFTITYAFISSIIVSMLSNATIVLQSMDMYDSLRPLQDI